MSSSQDDLDDDASSYSPTAGKQHSFTDDEYASDIGM